MPLAVDCPACKGPLLFDPSLYGQRIQCPACGHPFTVEAPDSGAPITAQPPRQRGIESATAQADVDPPAEEDESFEFERPTPTARPAPAHRTDLRSADWDRVRGGFTLILWSSLGIAVLTGILFWVGFSAVGQDRNARRGRPLTQREAEEAREAPRNRLKGIAVIQGVAILLGVGFVVGQVRLCGVPRQCGRGWCVAGAVVNLLGLLLMAGQLYFLYEVIDAHLDDPDAEHGLRLLTWGVLGAVGAGVVCWYLFLFFFLRYHERAVAGAMALVALACTLAYFTLVVALGVGFEVEAENLEGVVYLVRLGLLGGGVLIVGLYFGTLFAAWALVHESYGQPTG